MGLLPSAVASSSWARLETTTPVLVQAQRTFLQAHNFRGRLMRDMMSERRLLLFWSVRLAWHPR
jgi:hypothetical protein